MAIHIPPRSFVASIARSEPSTTLRNRPTSRPVENHGVVGEVQNVELVGQEGQGAPQRVTSGAPPTGTGDASGELEKPDALARTCARGHLRQMRAVPAVHRSISLPL